MGKFFESIHEDGRKAGQVFHRRLAIARGAALAALLTPLLVVMPAMDAAGAPAPDGADTYKVNCVVCHGEDGRGTETGKSLSTPDLHSDAVQKQTNAMLAQTISDGKNNMPPFMSVLSKAQIESLVVYVRTFARKGK
jgi:mono/diheme cytochrome c family protein